MFSGFCGVPQSRGVRVGRPEKIRSGDGPGIGIVFPAGFVARSPHDKSRSRPRPPSSMLVDNAWAGPGSWRVRSGAAQTEYYLRAGGRFGLRGHRLFWAKENPDTEPRPDGGGRDAFYATLCRNGSLRAITLRAPDRKTFRSHMDTGQSGGAA